MSACNTSLHVTVLDDEQLGPPGEASMTACALEQTKPKACLKELSLELAHLFPELLVDPRLVDLAQSSVGLDAHAYVFGC